MRSDVAFEGVHCTIRIRRPAERVVVVTITGPDGGEHGDAPMRELADDLGRGEVALFIDARHTKGANLDVSGKWAAWLGAHRAQFRRISMLTGSHFVQLTAEFVRRFADLGDRMHVYTEPGAFQAALSLACM